MADNDRVNEDTHLDVDNVVKGRNHNEQELNPNLPSLHPFWQAHMEEIQANLDALWMHLRRDPPNIGSP